MISQGFILIHYTQLADGLHIKIQKTSEIAILIDDCFMLLF